MKKFMIIVMVIWALAVNAQIDNLYSFNTSNQQVVQSAVEKGFVCVSSSYRLQDLKTKKLYGRNGNDAFGAVTSWGIKIEDGIIILDQAVRPWEYDSNFNKYRSKYGTIPYQLSFTEGNGKIIIDSFDAKTCNNQNTLYFVKDTLVAKGEGLKIDSSNGEKEGWMIWLTEEKDSSYTHLVFKKKIEFMPNNSMYEVERPNTTKKILAGIFVEPCYKPIGSVTFKLCGILVEKNGKWGVAKVSLNMTGTSTPKEELGTTVEQDCEDAGLTPIESNGKKIKKNKKNRK